MAILQAISSNKEIGYSRFVMWEYAGILFCSTQFDLSPPTSTQISETGHEPLIQQLLMPSAAYLALQRWQANSMISASRFKQIRSTNMKFKKEQAGMQCKRHTTGASACHSIRKQIPSSRHRWWQMLNLSRLIPRLSKSLEDLRRYRMVQYHQSGQSGQSMAELDGAGLNIPNVAWNHDSNIF